MTAGLARRTGGIEDPELKAQYTDCPGCPRCEPHGGYVLRRGSWRPTSAWEPILLLAKTPSYFADGEPVKTAAAEATLSRDQYTRVIDNPGEQYAVRHDHETTCDSGANARDVQTWAAEPLSAVICEQCGWQADKPPKSRRCPKCDVPIDSHYAAFPSALVQWCLKAGTSAKGYCPACGGPWVRVVETEKGDTEANRRPKQTAGMSNSTSTLSLSGNGRKEWAERGTSTCTIGWRPSCACIGAETFAPRPALVLDPFSGSGRTALAASRLGLDFVGVELNPEYVAMAQRLLHDDAPLFAGSEP